MIAKPSWLGLSLRVGILALALCHLSENTVDPDLWGHVVFGQRILASGHVEKTEPFSWTAPGAPWVNHEVLAEVILGAVHRLDGGRGLLLLKLAIGLLTFGLALRMGSRLTGEGGRTVAWVLAGLGVVEIGFGFAARPQIFTALALVVQLWLVTRVVAGAFRWALALPPLYLLWFNTHGGAALGLVLLLAASAACLAEWVWARRQGCPDPDRRRAGIMLGLGGMASAAVAFCTPWGVAAPLWLIRSIVWLRPSIQEWNPTPLGWEHAPFFSLAALALGSLAAAPKTRRGHLWTWVTLAVLGVAAARHVRHTPLFALAAVALLPGPLTSALERGRAEAARLLSLFQLPAVRSACAGALLLAAAGMTYETFVVRRSNPVEMEVPRADYPVAAIEFIRQNGLKGNLLVWFDWGEQCLWELPDCPVSIDGRLDTCYPMPLIDAHWRFYGGQMETGPDLDVRRADLALLPVGLKGWLVIRRLKGWEPVYSDELAELWVRDPSRFPALRGRRLPVRGSPECTAGREPFPRPPSSRGKAGSHL